MYHFSVNHWFFPPKRLPWVFYWHGSNSLPHVVSAISCAGASSVCAWNVFWALGVSVNWWMVVDRWEKIREAEDDKKFSDTGGSWTNKKSPSKNPSSYRFHVFLSGFYMNFKKNRWMKGSMRFTNLSSCKDPGSVLTDTGVRLNISFEEVHLRDIPKRLRTMVFSLTGMYPLNWHFRHFFRGATKKPSPRFQWCVILLQFGEANLKLHQGEEQHWNLNMPEENGEFV